MRRCCPPPAAPPYPYACNCAVDFSRYCSDGTGLVIKNIPASYLCVKWGADETYTTEAAAQIAANNFAVALARGRALNTVLTCNTLTPDDLLDCGLVEERPSFDPACALVLCDNLGHQICTDTGLNIEAT